MNLFIDLDAGKTRKIRKTPGILSGACSFYDRIFLLPPKESFRLPAQANHSPETTQANADG
jgi:hypothetical protein